MVSASVTHEVKTMGNLCESKKSIATCQSMEFDLNRFFSRYAPSE